MQISYERFSCRNCKYLKNRKEGNTIRPYCMARNLYLTGYYWCYSYRKKY